MSRYNTTYYLLILLLMTGTFASMAQNGYGIKIMGGVAAAFGAVFLIQGIQVAMKQGLKEPMLLVELYSLTLMAAILSMRIFYIYFPYVEVLFGLSGLILILVYVRKMMIAYPMVRKQSAYLASMVLLFYGSIILFIFSMAVTPFLPWLAEPAGIIAFGLIVIFTLYSLIKKEVLFDGDKVTAIRMATHAEHRTVVLLSIFILFSLYIGLNKIDLIPGIYSDEFPQAYFELVNSAETGEEVPIDGTFTHERYKELYDEVIKKHAGSFKR
jgi:hypothetical protein